MKDRDLAVSGLKADLVARLQDADAQAAPAQPPQPDPASTSIPEPLSASADDAAPAPQQLQDAAHPAPPGHAKEAVGGMGDAPPPSADEVNLPAKRHLEDAVAQEETKRIRTDAAIAQQVPPAGDRDAGTAAGEPVQVREAPSFASAPDLAQVGEGPNERVVAESKVPTEELVKAANGELAAGAGADEGQAAGEAEEEEEPPVYEYEPEEESSRPADLYLDTVRSSFSRPAVCRLPARPAHDSLPSRPLADQSLGTRLRL